MIEPTISIVAIPSAIFLREKLCAHQNPSLVA